LRASDLPAAEYQGLSAPFNLSADEGEAALFPLLRDGECVAILLGDGPLAEVLETASLASLLARSGSLLGL
jgi:hypothetical protein